MIFIFFLSFLFFLDFSLLCGAEKIYVFKNVTAIIDRGLIKDPLLTGISSVDCLVAVGRGQRQLILGDRQRGKMSAVLDIYFSAKKQAAFLQIFSFNSDVIFNGNIFCMVGRRAFELLNLINFIAAFDWQILQWTCFVSSGAADPAPFQWVAPFIGVTVGEYFAAHGLDIIIFLLDLSKHANAYRQLSLLLRRPPAREAFPGDVFYLHSRLLERCAKICENLGSGTLSGIPVVETLGGELAAYIPTNIISITDGQIFLDTRLFYAGTIPAVNLGLSVSRLGGSVQISILQVESTEVRADLSWYRELDRKRYFRDQIDIRDQDLLVWGDFLMGFIHQKKLSLVDFTRTGSLFLGIRTGIFEEYLREDEKIFFENIRGFRGYFDIVSHFSSYAGLCTVVNINYSEEIEILRAYNLILQEEDLYIELEAALVYATMGDPTIENLSWWIEQTTLPEVKCALLWVFESFLTIWKTANKAELGIYEELMELSGYLATTEANREILFRSKKKKDQEDLKLGGLESMLVTVVPKSCVELSTGAQLTAKDIIGNIEERERKEKEGEERKKIEKRENVLIGQAAAEKSFNEYVEKESQELKIFDVFYGFNPEEDKHK